jgi:hypothetical protein
MHKDEEPSPAIYTRPTPSLVGTEERLQNMMALPGSCHTRCDHRARSRRHKTCPDALSTRRLRRPGAWSSRGLERSSEHWYTRSLLLSGTRRQNCADACGSAPLTGDPSFVRARRHGTSFPRAKRPPRRGRYLPRASSVVVFKTDTYVFVSNITTKVSGIGSEDHGGAQCGHGATDAAAVSKESRSGVAVMRAAMKVYSPQQNSVRRCRRSGAISLVSGGGRLGGQRTTSR